jgi:hypothetical protein
VKRTYSATVRKTEKAIFMEIALFKSTDLERLNVFSLPALRPLGDVELHRLALLQALETACLDRGEVHKNILAILTADEAIAFGVVEPLYCSLFCHVDTGVPFNRFTLERFGGTDGRLLADKARAAHDRFDLTYSVHDTRRVADWQADAGVGEVFAPRDGKKVRHDHILNGVTPQLNWPAEKVDPLTSAA